MINVLTWLLLGGLAGLVAGRLIRPFKQGLPLPQIVAGCLGALVGGVVFFIFDTAPLHAFNAWGLLVALLGAALIIGVVQATVGRSI
jgi:uncharacterized membrane protein YeaQ/YmgE (transglycosylase-associated protein family)